MGHIQIGVNIPGDKVTHPNVSTLAFFIGILIQAARGSERFCQISPCAWDRYTHFSHRPSAKQQIHKKQIFYMLCRVTTLSRENICHSVTQNRKPRNNGWLSPVVSFPQKISITHRNDLFVLKQPLHKTYNLHKRLEVLSVKQKRTAQSVVKGELMQYSWPSQLNHSQVLKG